MASWQPISGAPKTKREDMRAISFIAWVPDDEAPDGGDVRIVWWEPRMKGGKGVWWSDRDLEEHPTLWFPDALPTPPQPEEG